MKKKDQKLIQVATIVGILVIGAFIYLNSDKSVEELPVTPPTARPRPQVEVPVPTETAPTTATVETPTQVAPTPKAAPVIVDNVIQEKADQLKAFKELIKLKVDFPQGMEFVKLDLDDGVAAMEGRQPGRKLLVLAAKRTANPETIAAFLRDQKNQIPMLVNFDFKVSGEVKKYNPPKGSGISSISVFPGGTNQGNVLFAAYLERSDRQGSYVFVMEASPSQFEKYEGDFDIMTDSLKTTP